MSQTRRGAQVLLAVTVLTLGLAATVTAQSPPAQLQPGGQEQPSMSAGPMGHGPMGGMGPGGMGGMGGVGMCPMMSAMMPMMGNPSDPQTQGRMLQMQGEMMKAIGDVLLKYGKAAEPAH